jgi:hypothetical protein
MVHGLALSAVLLTLGAIPVLPAFLGLWKDGPSSAGRAFVRTAAFFLLWFCFDLSWSGAAILVALWIRADGLFVIPSVLCLQFIAIWFSYQVAFSRDEVSVRGKS